MKERPILFKAPMVRALLAGIKTQTRRIVAEDLIPHIEFVGGSNDDCTEFDFVGLRYGQWTDDNDKLRAAEWLLYCTEYPEDGVIPIGQLYGAPGDRLWVRENGWERPERTPKMMREGADTWEPFYFDADGYVDTEHDQFKEWGFKRRPSIHMPRWASRILLEITGMRVERLQDISEEDAIAEGIERADDFFGCPCWKCYGEDADVVAPNDPIGSYRSLWESINGPGSWAANPWVWVPEFKRLKL